MKDMPKPADVKAYIAAHPKPVQTLLKQLRDAIRKAAPEAEEVISYGMPAYKYKGMLCYFASHTSHVGFYPMASGIAKFKKEIAGYKSAKGSVQFPFETGIPAELVNQMIRFRVRENEAKAAAKAKLKK
jgi:uncharacterized protein YdhG (YjbR/CyaY superfamily)